jgi:hypothetical protein
MGGSTDTIRWIAKGYGNIRLEFSSDAGMKWSPVSSQIPSKLNKLAWKIPSVTTKVALIRMIDAETEEEIAKSSFFKILSGSFKFRDPRAGDELAIGATSRIRWVAANVKKADIDISSDGGQSWNRLFSQVDVSNGYIYWTIAGPKTEAALLRAIWDGDPEMEFDRTQPFKIIDNNFVGELLPPGYIFGNAYPNPVKSSAFIDFEIPVEESLRISIFDAKGSEILIIGEREYARGKNCINIESENLPQGIYYINIRSSKVNIVREINVIK